MSQTRFGRRDVLKGGAALGAMAATGPLAARAARAQGAAGQPRRGGTLRVSVSQRVNHLNPLTHINNPEYMIGEMMYAGLTRLAATGMAPEPDLAERWEATPDATQWTFTLREGLTFHHGPALTAKDVVATFRAILDPATASPGRRNVGPIKSVTDLDARRVRFELDGSFADFPVNLAYSNARIAPAAILERDVKALDTAGYGAGPFKLARYEPGRMVRLERFDGYYNRGRPYLDAIEQVLYPDLAAETAAIVNAETDILLLGQPSDFPRLSRTPGVVAMRTPSGRFHNLVLRMDTPPFNDVRVRRALQLALDRQACLDLVFEGLGRVANDSPISPEYRFHEAIPAPQRDVAAARRLLAEAGHPQGLKIALACANRPPTRTALGVAIKELVRPAGFDIDVQTIPYDTYIANIWRKGNFYVGTFNMQAHEDAMYTLLFTTDAPWNDSQWNNRRFDELIYGARRTLDNNRRKEMYAEAQRLMVSEVPYLIPFYEDLLSFRRPYVQGYNLHPRGGVFMLENVWLAEGAPRRG